MTRTASSTPASFSRVRQLPRIGVPLISRRGLGWASVKLPRRRPAPAARMMAFFARIGFVTVPEFAEGGGSLPQTTLRATEPLVNRVEALRDRGRIVRASGGGAAGAERSSKGFVLQQ